MYDLGDPDTLQGNGCQEHLLNLELTLDKRRTFALTQRRVPSGDFFS